MRVTNGQLDHYSKVNKHKVSPGEAVPVWSDSEASVAPPGSDSVPRSDTDDLDLSSCNTTTTVD